MSELSLYFYTKNVAELAKTEFTASAAGSIPLVSSRGKYAIHGGNTFQWTSSVRALALLCAETSLARINLSKVVFAGEQGSAAASIDFAIEKMPNWLLEMFGEDSSGNPLIKTLVRRGNPHGKKPGPFLVSISENLNLKIYIDNIEVNKKDSLFQLIEQLRSQTKFKAKSISLLDEPNSKRNLKEYILDLYTTEAKQTLRTINPTDDRSLTKKKMDLANNPVLKSIAGNTTEDFLTYKSELSGSEKLGLVSDIADLRDKLSGLRVAIPPTLPASLAIFYGLKKKYGFDITIDYKFLHAVEIVSNVVNYKMTDLPDLLVLGNAPAATLLSSKFQELYKPAFLMPRLSHRVVGHKDVKRGQVKRYYMLKDEPATPLIYYDSLLEEKAISANKSETENIEGHEVFGLFEDRKMEDFAVLFFPHYDINRVFNDCIYFDSPDSSERFQDSPLLVHSELLRDPERIKALDIVIRSFWMSLVDTPGLLEDVMKELVDEPGFSQFVARVTGLFAIN